MSDIFNMADTWTAVGTTYNAIMMNVSDGAGGAPVGAAASRIVNLKKNGTSVFDIDVDGQLTKQLLNALGTITTSQPFTITQTWNDGAVLFNGLAINVTNTASSASSSLMELKVDNDSKFWVQRSGSLRLAANAAVYDLGNSFGFNYNITGELAASVRFALPVASPDVFLTRAAAASLRLGLADAAAPVAQTLTVQSVVAGTSNTAGPDWTLSGAIGTGTGAGGKIILKTAPAKASASTQNDLQTALTLTAPAVNMQPSVVCGNQALATDATDGFIYLCSGAGTPTGAPTTFTGRVALYIDTTNSQLWLYLGGAWKQPKTPAGAATVTWQ